MVTTLVRLGFDDPESLAVELEALGAWPPRPGANGHRLLEELAASANPTLATRALAAIAQATSDPGAFAAGLRRRPALRRRLIAVVAASRSLGRWLAAHPDEVERLGDGRALAAPRPRAELVRQARAAVPASAGVEAGWRGLRRFRRRELLRVAVRDLDGGAPVDSVGAELANLADACLQAGLELATRAQAAPGDPPVGLAVLAMGKLGGRELNYVSDIDVLFCHEPATGADAELAGKLGGAIARELIAGLGGPNPEGPGFQVDPNLRPEGRNGPLTRTLGSYLAYWDRWAEPWELQALIKVRPAAGDRHLGERFVAEAARRVYPERFDPATVAAVRHMKARVESSRAARAGGELQVKLGPGGLRDIEFAVQLLQLVHGRHDPALRSGTTLVALERLTAAGFVGRADAAQLAGAYRFLRTVEHRLQLTDERRTHTIPAGEAERRWLARTMGYPDGGPGGGGARLRPWDHGSHAEPSVSPPVRSPREGALERFEADRRRHAATVRGLHEKLFYRPLLEVFGAVPSGLDPSNAGDAAAGDAAGDAHLAGGHARRRRRPDGAAGGRRAARPSGRVLRHAEGQPVSGRAGVHRARHLAAARRAARQAPGAAHRHGARGRPRPRPRPGRAPRRGAGAGRAPRAAGGRLRRAAPLPPPRAAARRRARPGWRRPGGAGRRRADRRRRALPGGGAAGRGARGRARPPTASAGRARPRKPRGPGAELRVRPRRDRLPRAGRRRPGAAGGPARRGGGARADRRARRGHPGGHGLPRRPRPAAGGPQWTAVAQS